ncbi:hypothetical protein [Acinetobacter guillouiae]
MNEQTKKRLGVINRQNIAKYGTGAVLSTALVSNANAAFDVSGALTGSTAEANIETGATWILGIAVTIFAARKVIGFFSR